MSKKALSLVLTIIMTTSMIFSSFFTARGEELAQDTSTQAVAAADENTEPSSTVPETTVSKAKYPVLTVNAISNYFGKMVAEYNEFTREVTVLYTLKSSKRLLSTEWSVSYDTTILTLDPEKNTAEEICPAMKDTALMKLEKSGKDEGKLTFAATDLHMFDFTNEQATFVKLVFDVAPLTENDSEITKVDLTLDYLSVSEPSAIDGKTVPEKEIILIANSKIQNDSSVKQVRINKGAFLTPATFVEREDDATEDEVTSAVVTKPVVTKATQPAKPAKPVATKKTEDKSIWVKTGEWYIALLILLVLLTCSTVLFVMRKRDIYNNY